MKVRLTIDLDIPDECGEWGDDFIYQYLFDVYVNYVTISHCRDAVQWCGKANESPTAERIYKQHQLWGKITSQPEWTMERLD